MGDATTVQFVQRFEPAVPQGKRFSDLVRSLSDDEAAARVPGIGWTAAEVGAHVATMLGRYVSNQRRSSTRPELAAQNDGELRALVDEAGGEVGSIADAIDEAMATIAAVAPQVPADMEFPFHLDTRVTAAAGWANLLSEFLVHGDDIARATGREWSFPESDLEGFWRNLLPAASGWLRHEARAIDEVYEFRFAAFGPVVVWIHDGRVTVDDADRTPDHTCAVDDAVPFTLAVPWRRRLVADPAAALFLSRFYDI